ncbi:hypothetical protein [Pyrococcus kukulkanii]|uniref:hypothetical protein n=1 Tax=Pyrococcus kukulkanii TaxID=1609559 RepID=UPI0035675755
MVTVEGLEEDGFTVKANYPDEYRGIVHEFLGSVAKSVKGKGGLEWWTTYEVDRGKWWRALKGMVVKYSYDPKALAVLGHLAWEFQDCEIITVE